MRIEKKINYTLITAEEKEFPEFYNLFLKKEKTLEKEHLVLLFSNNIDISDEDCLVFLNISSQKKENGTSFAIVHNTINIDDFPETFNIVPTLQEAEDIIEMEAIERELGF